MKSDDTKILASYNNSSVYIIDIETCKLINEMNFDEENISKPNLQSQINHIVSHPSKPLLFTANEDNYIRYFDLRTSKCIHSMVGHLASVSSLCIDSSGEYLISGGHDSSLRFWSIGNHTCIQEIMVSNIQ